MSNGRVIEYRVTEAPQGVHVETPGRLGKAERDEMADKVTWMFGLDQDFSAFYKAARGEPKLRQARKLAHGRVLRSPTFFEDVLKTILTTNTFWGATKRMNLNLIDAFGAASDGSRIPGHFPHPSGSRRPARRSCARKSASAIAPRPSTSWPATSPPESWIIEVVQDLHAANTRTAQGTAEDPGRRSVRGRQLADDPGPLGFHPDRHLRHEDGLTRMAPGPARHPQAG